MEELLDKIDKLKESLDKEKVVIRIKSLNKDISKDKKLISLINDYRKYPTEDKKLVIYSNKLYREYKESETSLNLLIMGINSKLKELNNKRNCK